MSDFDLSDALDCPPDSRRPPSDTEDVEHEVKLSDDLDLMVTRNRTTMKRVANLVLAVNKLSRPLSLCGRELSDVELCGAILECVVEETIFKEEWNSFPRQLKPLFRRCSSSVCEVTVCDEFHKDLILTTQEMRLQAITLRAGNEDREVNFVMCYYNPPPSIPCLTVLLSVSKNLHISCSMEEGKVSLKLEQYSQESLKEISQADGLDRFLFYKNPPPGGSMYRFESVKFRGWFISTSSVEVDNSVEMCQETAHRVTCFRVMEQGKK
ncbi:interleukin-1 beta isoform X2 [Poeciliopsis prolifica]|uniref:interleukin-1 beta isoform X2 n=1 Tax=Poeciliopsis prolifica TaxID=188132 RepID=UPI0024145B3C|nr:interleukin-1 beta isoform X2 [Poeciliopsis prolifica]